MMKVWNKIQSALGWVWSIIGRNGLFFVFMYLLGCVVAWVTLPDTKGAKLYDNLYPELLLDVTLLALILRIIPGRIRCWTRGVLCMFAYAVALTDVYCFVKFDSTLTPTMLLLVGETNSREASEFLNSLISTDLLFSKLGWVVLLMIANIACAILLWMGNRRRWNLKRLHAGFSEKTVGHLRSLMGLLLVVMFSYSAATSFHNKKQIARLMTAPNIGTVEHQLTEKEHARLYQPAYRLAFSIYANTLTAQQLVKLQAAADEVKVDSCSYASPNIVLIIGESYNRHHSQQYGYWQPTTPRQTQMEKTGRLVKYTDVVAPWNLTSFVFKLLFSTYTVGDKGEWCDYPLFPELFRAAGYHVTFITNQFLPKAKEAVYDFSGGFFLNDPKLSKAQFDTRNTRVFPLDEYLLGEYDRLKKDEKEHNLTIFHLSGMHVNYKQRYPAKQRHFQGDDYKESHPHLDGKERKTLSDYDNAILYNDSIVAEIVKKFDDRDAIVIYVPDHGEECYEDGLHFFCRMHSAEITARLAHAEFDIPFWIYCTHEYAVRHADIYKQVVDAKGRKYMTDALPHLLMYLAGIHSRDYREDLNLLGTEYNEARARILKNTTDYDKLK